jgi:ATP-dependent DNA ligase
MDLEEGTTTGDNQGTQGKKIKKPRGILSQIITSEDSIEPTLFIPFMPMESTNEPNKTLFYETSLMVSELSFKTGVTYLVEENYSVDRGVIHKKGDEVKIFSEQGKDITSKFTTIAKAVLEMNGDFIIDGVVFGNRFNCFDLVYFDKPLNNLQLYERKKLLRYMNLKPPLYEVPFTAVNNADDFIKAVNLYSSLEFSDGAVVKQHNSQYLLGKKTPFWITFKKESGESA